MPSIVNVKYCGYKSRLGRTISIVLIALGMAVLSVRHAPTIVRAQPNSTIQITDVFGLSDALALRPTMGTGFFTGRAAVVNSAGQIETAIGPLGNCVVVDGSALPCGGGGSPIHFVDNEVPIGVKDGMNPFFSLLTTPQPLDSLKVFRNGLRLAMPADYSLNGKIITFANGSIPQAQDLLLVEYRY